MNVEFSNSDGKILGGEGKKNLRKRKSTKRTVSTWKAKQATSPEGTKAEGAKAA